VDYARVYRVESGIPVGANFRQAAVLEGYGLDALTVRGGRGLSARLFWRAFGPVPPDMRVVLSLRDTGDREVARSASPIGVLEPGQVRSREYQLQVTSGLAAGEYLLWVELETGAGQTLALAGRPEALAGRAPERPDRAVLRSIRVR
jgi:hypothetical protein